MSHRPDNVQRDGLQQYMYYTFPFMTQVNIFYPNLRERKKQTSVLWKCKNKIKPKISIIASPMGSHHPWHRKKFIKNKERKKLKKIVQAPHFQPTMTSRTPSVLKLKKRALLRWLLGDVDDKQFGGMFCVCLCHFLMFVFVPLFEYLMTCRCAQALTLFWSTYHQPIWMFVFCVFLLCLCHFFNVCVCLCL